MIRRSNGSLPTNPDVQEMVLSDGPSDTPAPDRMQAIIGLVLDAVESPHTRWAYERALIDFTTWVTEQRCPLNRALVRRYVAELRESEMGEAAINQRLSAIRTLIRELTD